MKLSIIETISVLLLNRFFSRPTFLRKYSGLVTNCLRTFKRITVHNLVIPRVKLESLF